MDRLKLNRIAALSPLAFSALAFALVVGNIAAGVAPQPDEGASAHIWQLLMIMQLPLILLFAATADWRATRSKVLFAAQLLAIVLACAPVLLGGY